MKKVTQFIHPAYPLYQTRTSGSDASSSVLSNCDESSTSDDMDATSTPIALMTYKLVGDNIDKELYSQDKVQSRFSTCCEHLNHLNLQGSSILP